MPGLVRGMARTAAIVGTASATRHAVARRNASKDAAAYSAASASVQPPPQQGVYAEPPQQAAPVEYAPPPEPTQDDVISQLERIGALHAQGILTDEEFAAQKAKILAG